jgi:cytoskeleton protein RodZ
MAKRGLQFLPQKKMTEASPLGASVELGVGDILRMTRERKGQELQSVANQLRIRLAYLEAIEEGRYKDLPGSTYAVGFVRSYGDYLELDGADIVRRFREEVARIHGRTRLIPPVIAADGTIPPAAILLLSIVGLGIAYGTWYYLSSSEQSEIPVVQEVPDRLINAPDSPGEAPPESEHAPAAGTTNGSSLTPSDSATPAPPAGTSAEAADVAPETASEPQDSAETADGTTSSSTLSTIMAPEPMPPPEATPPAIPVTTPPPAEPPPSVAVPETVPPASSSTTTGTADTGGPAAPVPGTPVPDTAGDQTAATQPEIATAPLSPPPAVDSATTPPVTPAPAPAAPATGGQGTAATGNGIPAAPSLPAAPEVEPDDTQQTATAFTGARIRIHARLDTWVKIVDHNGRTVLNRVLTSGESYDVPDEAGLKMITGNAGGMDILVDGAAIAPLGEPGKVRRDVALDPEKLKAGTAIPQ